MLTVSSQGVPSVNINCSFVIYAWNAAEEGTGVCHTHSDLHLTTHMWTAWARKQTHFHPRCARPNTAVEVWDAVSDMEQKSKKREGVRFDTKVTGCRWPPSIWNYDTLQESCWQMVEQLIYKMDKVKLRKSSRHTYEPDRQQILSCHFARQGTRKSGLCENTYSDAAVSLWCHVKPWSTGKQKRHKLRVIAAKITRSVYRKDLSHA